MTQNFLGSNAGGMIVSQKKPVFVPPIEIGILLDSDTGLLLDTATDTGGIY